MYSKHQDILKQSFVYWAANYVLDFMYHITWIIPLIVSAGMTSGTYWLHHALICYVTFIGFVWTSTGLK